MQFLVPPSAVGECAELSSLHPPARITASSWLHPPPHHITRDILGCIMNEIFGASDLPIKLCIFWISFSLSIDSINSSFFINSPKLRWAWQWAIWACVFLLKLVYVMFISNLFVFQSIEYLIRSGESHVAPCLWRQIGLDWNWIGQQIDWRDDACDDVHYYHLQSVASVKCCYSTETLELAATQRQSLVESRQSEGVTSQAKT